ncbi:Ig-like domain-containing protein, partial [uncultured Prochlorococcus sp.]|uniref:Ig-like domain-containing protein n=1 Tax=uncultured Prochlorococcus sp. TaxID=159733 RepID=UPI00258F36AA
NIELTFSEAVNIQSGYIYLKKSLDNSVVEVIDVNGSQITGDSSKIIQIDPLSDLESSTQYYVNIDASAFDDSSNNSFSGISSKTALSFTTADVEAPNLSSSSPADNATSVGVNSNIELTFSETVEAKSGSFYIRKSSDDSIVEKIDVLSSQVSGSGSNLISIKQSSDLSPETEYYLQIDASAFDDLSGNSFSGISSKTDLSFTTFSPWEYLAANPDLILILGSNYENSLQHYKEHGKNENRNTSITSSSFESIFPDLENNIGQNSVEKLVSYFTTGHLDGPYSEVFDEWAYLASHPDVLLEGGANNSSSALVHYLKHGISENRSLEFFEPDYLSSVISTDGDSLTQENISDLYDFLNTGKTQIGIQDEFDALNYIASYGDLIDELGSDEKKARTHYIQYGIKEGRNIDTFDEWNYLASNVDLIEESKNKEDASIFALQHYINFGYSEDRDTNSFNSNLYKNNYGDLSTSLSNEMAAKHFVQIGFEEGRTDNQIL